MHERSDGAGLRLIGFSRLRMQTPGATLSDPFAKEPCLLAECDTRSCRDGLEHEDPIDRASYKPAPPQPDFR